jgi:hypothetical protein
MHYRPKTQTEWLRLLESKMLEYGNKGDLHSDYRNNLAFDGYQQWAWTNPDCLDLPPPDVLALNSTWAVMLNLEFVHKLLQLGLPKEHLHFFADCKFRAQWAKQYCGLLESNVYLLPSNIKEYKEFLKPMSKKFDGVFVNPPFKYCKEFRTLAKDMSTRYVWMITKTDHMDDVRRFDDVVYFKHLGDKAFKEQIITCSFLIDLQKSVNDNIRIVDVTGNSKDVQSIVLPPGPSLNDWEYASKVISLGLPTYNAGGGYVGQGEATKVKFGGVKCIWRCGPVGGEFEWDMIDNKHKDQVYGLGKHKIIVSKMTSVGNLGDVKYAPPEFGVGSTCYRVELDSKEDCEAAIEYLNTPQVKKLLKGIKTMTASSSNKIWSKIPHHSEKDKWFSIV